jgi:hypothetical protein
MLPVPSGCQEKLWLSVPGLACQELSPVFPRESFGNPDEMINPCKKLRKSLSIFVHVVSGKFSRSCILLMMSELLGQWPTLRLSFEEAMSMGR